MAWTDARMAGAGDGWAIWREKPSTSTQPQSIEPDIRPTVLVAGPGETAAGLASLAERAGFRSIGSVSLQDVAQRLTQLIAVDFILLDLRHGALDSATARALAMRQGLPDARLAVMTDLANLDFAHAWLDARDVEILCDPASCDIVSLLVMAAMTAEQRRSDPCFHSDSRDDEAARFEQLSSEVRRLVTTIEQLTHHRDAQRDGSVKEPGRDYRGMDAPSGQAGTEGQKRRGQPVTDRLPSAGEIRALLRARRLREQYLAADLFADPAWDMILDLMAARLTGKRVSVSSLCIAAAVPPTTALRWIRQLTERGVFARIDDPADGRRVFIELTEAATESVAGWTQAVRRNGGLLNPA
jgi:DNA-binding MarR family transcriptional regulator/ActR/RegA family two-component response regulator